MSRTKQKSSYTLLKPPPNQDVPLMAAQTYSRARVIPRNCQHLRLGGVWTAAHLHPALLLVQLAHKHSSQFVLHYELVVLQSQWNQKLKASHGATPI